MNKFVNQNIKHKNHFYVETVPVPCCNVNNIIISKQNSLCASYFVDYAHIGMSNHCLSSNTHS